MSCLPGDCRISIRKCLLAAGVFSTVIFFLAAAVSAAETFPGISVNDNRTLAGKMDSGVLTLHLELKQGVWHPEAQDGPAIKAASFAERGQELETPGPLIRVPQGTQVRVSVHNLLSQPAFVHGLHQRPGKADDAMELAPGETKETTFTAGAPGSYFYWASTTKGPLFLRAGDEGLMSGAFIVDGPGADTSDRIFVIGLWFKELYRPGFEGILAINGKSWPHTERLQAQIGKAEHWRIVNTTPLEHPMHLHGFFFDVDAFGDGENEQHLGDGAKLKSVTHVVEPGETFDMTWVPERAGNWVFHCHILDHMMSDYKSPTLYGPDGPPADKKYDPHKGMAMDNTMGMGDLVMGITVTDPNPQVKPVKDSMPEVMAKKDLYVRERPASAYVPAGPGFYLEGVSKQVEGAGPPLVITRGERTAITVHNELREATAIHWHGLEIESYYDGVPGWDGTPQRTTPYIAPGGTFVAYMTPPRAGTFIYHTHWNDVTQLTGGMYGALLVLEPDQTYDPETDKVFVLGRSGLNEMKDPLMVNGSPQPGVMVVLPRKTYRLRFVNMSPNDMAMVSLVSDGKPVKWSALAKDGAALPPQQATVRDAEQKVGVGETYDFEFTPTTPGDYKLRFSSDVGSEVTQWIAVVPPESPFSVYVAKQ